MPRQTNPRKKLREVLFSIHPLSYRIRTKELDKESMNKKLFVQIVKQLRKIEDRRDFMAEEIGMDMTTYEDQFFRVCLLYTSPSPRDLSTSRMPSSA